MAANRGGAEGDGIREMTMGKKGDGVGEMTTGKKREGARGQKPFSVEENGEAKKEKRDLGWSF